MRSVIAFNDSWIFREGLDEDRNGDLRHGEAVRLPHSAVELPYNYFDVPVIVRALDQAGNKMPFFDEPVAIRVEGPGRRIGPEIVPLRGGSTGFWLESTGEPGAIMVEVSTGRLGTATIAVEAQ